LIVWQGIVAGTVKPDTGTGYSVYNIRSASERGGENRAQEAGPMNNASFHPRSVVVALILAVFSVSLQSCGKSILPQGPSPTETSFLPPTPTATPLPTPTLSYTEWPLVMSDSFDETSANWQVGDLNNEFFKGTLAIVGGKYYIKLTAKKAFIWANIPQMPDLLDAYASVKVDQKSGSKTAEYGLIVRDNANSQYFFSVSTLQQGYEFSKYSAKTWSVLTLWTNSSKILPGEPDQIGVKAEGVQFVFYINGQPVDDAKDTESVLGKVGIGVALMKAGDSIEITFDNFEVRAPK
jgi:hypothetical protein